MKPFDRGFIAVILRGKLTLLNLVHFLFYFTQMKMKATKQVKNQSLFLLKTWNMFLLQMQLCR